jgi:hypothetical protein
MMVGVGLVVFVVFAGIFLRSRSDKPPLNRDELLRMRQYYERIHREEVLPFE